MVKNVVIDVEMLYKQIYDRFLCFFGLYYWFNVLDGVKEVELDEYKKILQFKVLIRDYFGGDSVG